VKPLFLLTIVAALSVAPSALAQEQESSADPESEALAQEAHAVLLTHCAEAGGADMTRAAESVAVVSDVWARVSAQVESSRKVYLLYWRGVLAQCLDQEERALQDLQSFVGARKGSDLWAGLISDAERRITRLERQVTGPRPVEPGWLVGGGLAGRELVRQVRPKRHLRAGGLTVDGRLLFPLGGRSKVRVIGLNEDGHFPIYVADEHGFRNPLGSHRPQDGLIVLVGDSWTEGVNVDDGAEIAALLRGRLKRPVLNLGLSGNGPLIELGSIIEYARPLQPAEVLWLWFANDARDLQAEWTVPLLLSYLEPEAQGQGLRSQQAAIDEAIEVFARQPRFRPKLDQPLRHRIKRGLRGFASLPRIRSRTGWARAVPTARIGRVLRAAQDEVQRWGGRLTLVVIPSLSSGPSHKAIVTLGRELGLSTVDLLPLIRDRAEPMELYPLGISGHWNGKGNALAADAIAAQFEEPPRPP